MSGDCILRTFTSPSFSGMMPGARFDFSTLEVSAEEMPCCGGAGVRLVDQQGRGSMVRCELKPRLAMVQTILSKYAARWGTTAQQFPIEKTAGREDQHLILRRLALLEEAFRNNSFSKEASRGMGFQTRAPGADPQPGAVWWAAAAAAWRFGFKVHVVDTDAARKGPILPSDTWQRDSRQGSVFVDRVGGLWDPGLAQEMETLIGFCARAGIPLWLSRQDTNLVEEKNGSKTDVGKTDTEKTNPIKSKLTTKAAFSRRIAASRNRSWDSWFREAVRDRLQETMDPF